MVVDLFFSSLAHRLGPHDSHFVVLIHALSSVVGYVFGSTARFLSTTVVCPYQMIFYVLLLGPSFVAHLSNFTQYVLMKHIIATSCLSSYLSMDFFGMISL